MVRRAVGILATWCVASVLLTIAAPHAAAAAPADVAYRAPSAAPIVDRFDLPPERWMPGNRGIDYGTDAGAPIAAAADGRVVFAGAVGGTLHVTVLHADGLRTSYSFVASIAVSVGDRVRVGDVIAIADGPFHFGVRTPDGTYLDPEAVLAGSVHPTIRLVPGTDDGLDALRASEGRSLFDVLVGGGVAATHALASWSAEANSLLVHYAIELQLGTHVARVLDAVREWIDDRSTCTDASTAVPPPTERRIVVLVSGLGTSSASNTALEIDTATLGYAPADVVPYSYNGGRAPRPRAASPIVPVVDPASDPFRAIPQTEFASTDSQQSLSVSADQLAVLLQEVAAAQPGVPIDVIAHSQGGVVARLAVERAGDAGRLPASVASLVTVASPQQGAPLATSVAALHDTPGGAAALSQVRAAGLGDGLDDRLPAIEGLGETSGISTELHQRRVPDRVRFVTIGGSGDLVVPGTTAIDPTADASVVLPTDVGTAVHGTMPSSPAATREIGLAIAGRGPTCRSLGSVVTGAITAETVRWGEASLGAALVGGLGTAPVPPGD